MAKKHQWKQAIRAEVAAALQQQKGQTQSASTRITQSPPISSAGGVPSIVGRDTLPAKKDLLRIGIVAGVLLGLLVIATVTDHQNGWLDRLASQVVEKI